jgi:hypothetical protein
MPKYKNVAAAAAWIGIPFVLYLVALRHFWFNTPLLDDFDAVLDDLFELHDASSAREWLGLLVALHNEHRIAFSRLVTWIVTAVLGGIDFRALTVVANLGWLAILGLMWAELRRSLSPWILAGAAFLVLNLAYYEASLLPMAGLSNFWANFFGFACLYFAMRERRLDAALAVACGVVAVGTLASGLVALPLAAAFSALRRRPARAAIFAVAALVLWVVYFIGYVRPAYHPSSTHVLAHPIDASKLFLVVAGGLFPSVDVSIAVGLLLLLAIGWALYRGLWQRSPTTCAWIAFVLASIAAITVGRSGFGVFHASRYAVYASLLVALAVLAAAVVTAPWKPRANVAFLIGCAGFSALVSWSTLPWAVPFSFRARLVAKAQPQAPDVITDPYFGVFYPALGDAYQYMDDAARRGLWHARELPVYPTSVRFEDKVQGSMERAGRVDTIEQAGTVVRVVGWSHLPASLPGRVFAVSGAAAPIRAQVKVASRLDVATGTGVAALVSSGFELRLDYGSAEEAKKAAASLCLVAEDSRRQGRMLAEAPGCPKAPA